MPRRTCGHGAMHHDLQAHGRRRLLALGRQMLKHALRSGQQGGTARGSDFGGLISSCGCALVGRNACVRKPCRRSPTQPSPPPACAPLQA